MSIFSYFTPFIIYTVEENSSSNIYKIAKNAINNIERPSYLCR